jgi:hypothetical protein
MLGVLFALGACMTNGEAPQKLALNSTRILQQPCAEGDNAAWRAGLEFGCDAPEDDNINAKYPCKDGRVDCEASRKVDGNNREVSLQCKDGTYTCEEEVSYKQYEDGSQSDFTCNDKGCKKGSSGKADYSVKLNPGQLDILLKTQVKKAFIGARNADGRWAKLAGFMPFVGNRVQHVALWVDEGKKGVVIEYGDYENTWRGRTNTFFSESGARLSLMSLDKFHQTHEALEMKVGEVQTLKEMWKELDGKKEWNVQKYDSVTHNCQHFVVSAMKALKLTGTLSATQQSTYPPLVNAQLKAK